MTSFGCGRYQPNMLLIHFTLKRTQEGLKVLNRHMKGIIWLAWKFLWQQLAAIEAGNIGIFHAPTALVGMAGMHHTAVLAALHDYTQVQQAKKAGARKYCSKEQEHAENYRVWPFVSIEGAGCYKYTRAYAEWLDECGVKKSDHIDAP